MESDDEYILVCGARRLECAKQLGWTEIQANVMAPIEAEEVFMMEFAENERRKNFSKDERFQCAKILLVIEKEKAHQRKLSGLKQYPKQSGDSTVETVTTQASERTIDDDETVTTQASERTIDDDETVTARASERKRPITARERNDESVAKAAKASGFGGGTQLKQLLAIQNKRPDLYERVKSDELKVTTAYNIMRKEAEIEKVGELGIDYPPDPFGKKFVIEYEKVEYDLLHSPGIGTPDGEPGTLEGYDHDTLMSNAVYANLYNANEQLRHKGNTQINALATQLDGMKKRLRDREETIIHLNCTIDRQYRLIQELKGESHENRIREPPVRKKVVQQGDHIRGTSRQSSDAV
jgi:hypothetical protein